MRDPDDPWGGGGEPIAPLPADPVRPWHLTPEAITRCPRCDSEGYRGVTVCDHRDPDDAKAAAKRGMELVREALQRKEAR